MFVSKIAVFIRLADKTNLRTKGPETEPSRLWPKA